MLHGHLPSDDDVWRFIAMQITARDPRRNEEKGGTDATCPLREFNLGIRIIERRLRRGPRCAPGRRATRGRCAGPTGLRCIIFRDRARRTFARHTWLHTSRMSITFGAVIIIDHPPPFRRTLRGLSANCRRGIDLPGTKS